MRSCKVAVEANACILWAFLLLILPLRWMIAFFLALSVHELFHLLALCAFHKPVLQFRIGPLGMKMDIQELGYGQELLCALAGPLGGFLLLLSGRWYPELALCALAQSCYNLIPVYPLDGGRVLRCLLHLLIPESADGICRGVETVVFTGFLVLSFWLKWSLFAILLACILIVRAGFGKIPCKPTFLRVQ